MFLFLLFSRFVLDTCRRLKEKKSYMIYTAVGCLGISALSDMVKEVVSEKVYLIILLESLIFIGLCLMSYFASKILM